MLTPLLDFDDVKNPGMSVSIPANAQISVTPGPSPDTAIVITPDGQRAWVVGTVQEIQIKIQAAAARSHENGDAPMKNASIS